MKVDRITVKMVISAIYCLITNKTPRQAPTHNIIMYAESFCRTHNFFVCDKYNYNKLVIIRHLICYLKDRVNE